MIKSPCSKFIDFYYSKKIIKKKNKIWLLTKPHICGEIAHVTKKQVKKCFNYHQGLKLCFNFQQFERLDNFLAQIQYKSLKVDRTRGKSEKSKTVFAASLV